MAAAGTSTAVSKFAVPHLYRRLVKLYIRKFDNDIETTVRAWKQTRREFMFYRDATPDEVPLLLERGTEIYNVVLRGIVPIREDPKTGKVFVSYDNETLNANSGYIEPISAEEALRRQYKSFEPEQLKELQQRLVAAGRWQGKLEFDRVPNMKKKKVRCTDPDE